MAGHISEGAAGTHCTVKQPAEPTMSCKPHASNQRDRMQWPKRGRGSGAPQWRQQAGQASGLSFPTINFSRCLILYLQTSYPLCTTQPSVYHHIWAQK
uniref:Uncharacterized protein n=1 Tax=Theropithecus gelada TaxID=9565 RepID=A0A8D2F1V2_THEGE